MTSVAALSGIAASGTKRTADEFLASMAGVNDHQKKAKIDGSLGTPSKVIHVRNVSNDATDTEIIALGLPFGTVSNVLLLTRKGQAFLEMADENSAMNMLSYYSYMAPTVRGRPVYLQFSTHKELTTTQHTPTALLSTLSQQSGMTSRILAAATGDASLASNLVSSLGAAGAGQTADWSSGSGGSILRVVVENMLYPVNVDILHQIFSRCGTVQKVVTFTKNNQFQALIQFSTADEAYRAKCTMDSQNIYNGCCTLNIDFSKLSVLTVKYNNDKSRDYTRPDLPSNDGMPNASDRSLGLQLGGVLQGSLLGMPFGGGLGSLFPAAGMQSGGRTVMMGGSPVVLVSNLNEDMINCDVLFTLFGVYGDVHRVKILFNKKDTALIQFNDTAQSQTSVTNLNGVKLYGKEMKVTPSKHSSVSLPREGQEDNNLTKDYSNSPLHRFKKPGSKNFQNIFPPIRTLHISNIPSTSSEEDIKAAFSAAGTVTNFRFFPNDRKMALIQMATVEESINALIKVHNTRMGETNHLRVSFARTNM